MPAKKRASPAGEAMTRPMDTTDTPPPPSNGHDTPPAPGPTRNAPQMGLEDLLIGGGRPAAFNVPKELITGSEKPLDTMARTEVSDEDIEVWQQCEAIDQRFTMRFIDPHRLDMGVWTLNMSKNRKSRDEVVEVAKAQDKKMAANWRDKLLGHQDMQRPLPQGTAP